MTAILLILAISVLSNANSRGSGAREALFDFYQRLIPAKGETADAFHVVTIDTESLTQVGPWPWPRSLSANLVASAKAAGAKGVIYLEGVDTPDPLSPETIGAFWLGGTRDNALAEQLALLPSTDALLASAFQNGGGGVAIDPGPRVNFAQDLINAKANISGGRFVLTGNEERGGTVSAPLATPRYRISPDLQLAANTVIASLPNDADGVLRAPPLLWSVDGRPAPLGALEAARMALGADGYMLEASDSSVNANGRTLVSISTGGITLPVDPQTKFRLYFPKRPAVQSTPAWRLLDRSESNRQLAGKVVLIGLDASVGAPVNTPRGQFSRPEAHALMAQQLVAGNVTMRPGWTGYLEALLVMLLGAAAIMWSQRLDFWKALGVAAIVSAVMFAVSAGAFSAARLLIDPLPASLALFLGAFSVAGGRSIGAVLTDDHVRGGFQGALPEPTMKRLRDEGAGEILDGARREITVLACELRLVDEDLDKLSDTPEQVTTMLAAAAASLRKSITELGGAVDQADGGKIFAYFNAPLETADHVRAACSAALRLIESMDRINAELDASPRARNTQIHLGIGIASGECFVGPMGHGKTNRYSAIGTAVELASFLRRQAEHYGPAIICDESIYRRTHHHFAFLELDKLRARDNERAFSIYALVGNPFIKSSKGYRALEESHRQLLASYREGDFAAARQHLAAARQSPGAKIALFDIYDQRLRDMNDRDLPDGWDGAMQITY